MAPEHEHGTKRAVYTGSPFLSTSVEYEKIQSSTGNARALGLRRKSRQVQQKGEET